MTLGDASTDTLNVGNGGLIKDASGNLGLGVTPSTWFATSRILQIGSGGAIESRTNFDPYISTTSNAYLDTTGVYKYIGSAEAGRYLQSSGVHSWYQAASGTAGNAITFTQAMTLTAAGNLLVGPTSDGGYKIATSVAASGSFQNAITMTNASDSDLSVRIRTGETSLINSGSAAALTFATNSIERVRIDSSGNLGVGVTPSAWASGTYKVVQLSGGGAFSGSSGQVNISQNFVGESGGEKYIATAPVTSYAQTAGAHRWYNAPSGTAGSNITFTQAMTLDASGNQLLGVTSNTNANNRLYVVGPLASYTSSATTLATSATSASVRLSFAQDSSQSIFMGMATDGTNYPSYIQAANGGGTTASNLTLQPFGGSLLVGTVTAYGGKVDILQSANSTGVVIRCTDASYATHPLDLAVDRNTTNNSYYFIRAAVTGVQYRFQVADSGNVTNINNSYGAISDIKLKENIVDATPKLAGLMQVKVRNYNLIGDTAKRLGVVAQELETVFPSMIDESPDRDAEGNDLGTTTKAVKYSVFVPMLIKAIQEQQALITTLTARITALEGA